MTLLRQIQDAALDSDVDLADLLRKCKVLASRLKHAEFGDWVTNELNGYPDNAEVPAYRKLRVHSLGHFTGPFGSGMRNAPIPAALVPEKLRHVVHDQVFLEPVGALAAHVSKQKNTTLHAKWPADIIAYLQRRHPMYEDMVLADAWRVIPSAAIRGILDTIRTRVLDFALALEEQEPMAGDNQPGEKPKVTGELVTNIYNTTIHGGLANVGVAGNASIRAENFRFSEAVPSSHRQELTRLLHELRTQTESVADNNERAEASDALARVQEQLANNAPKLDRISKYLELYSTIVTVAAPTVDMLKALLQQLFGG